ncbi:MAG: hypothetical protein IPH53_16315 [Flavobacteriales bacterium]|nr:hypothetical protein [Flavobacteriales bacterium]MBK9540279.1 hypothetical protein [Flavobacteriales bacterium]
MHATIDIGPATLERVRPDLVVIRFKPGTIADPASFQQSMGARKEHCSDTPHMVMLVAPEDVDFDPSVLGKNHYKDQGAEAFTLGLALVSRNPTLMNILELYYALHPAPFPVSFFREESEALPWVEAQLARRKV